MSIFKNFQSELINLNYLLEASDGDEDFMKMMIMSFISNHLNYLEQIKQFITEKNYTNLYSVVHKYRGSVNIIGIEKLQKQLLIVENNAIEKIASDIKIIEDIEEISKIACKQLQDFMVAENIW